MSDSLILNVVFFLLILSFFGILIAFIKQKKENQKLRSELDQASKKFQFSQKFISLVSQELRTPLYGIMGLTNLLSQQKDPAIASKHLKSLKFTGNYLFNLINNILHINFLDVNKIELDKKVVYVKEVVSNIIDSFNYAAVTKNNTIHLDYDTSIPEKLITDTSLLSQVLMNLLNNALRFTRNGNVYIKVENAKKNITSHTLVFKITHDGNGVSKEEKRSLYEEFSDLDAAKNSYLGTGLDATIVNKLAETMDAEIIVNQGEDSGSEYAFILDMEMPEGNNNNNTRPIQNTKGLHALIVDDNKLNLLIAEKIIASEGFDCTTVDNGFEAIDLVKQNKYDIILMDINMPKLNGIGTTKRIRRFNTEIPIIALTAVDVTQINRQILRAGFNDYLLKPYDRNLLIEIVNKQLYREELAVE